MFIYVWNRLTPSIHRPLNSAGCYRWWTRDFEAMRSVNEDGARIVGLAAAETDVAVVQVSTVLAQRRSSHYARTKADGDAHLKRMAEEGKVTRSRLFKQNMYTDKASTRLLGPLSSFPTERESAINGECRQYIY